MNPQSYIDTMRILLVLYLPMFFLNYFGEYIVESWETLLLSVINYYLYRVLTIIILLFSIYARLFGVKKITNFTPPSTYIILGAIFAALSFAPPIFNYFIMSDIKIEPTSKMSLIETKDRAVDINTPPGGRSFLAMKYYLNTGDRILYLNNDDKKVIYSPDEETVRIRDRTAEYEYQVKMRKDKIKITALSLIGILVVSLISFAVLLFYKYKKNGTLRTLGKRRDKPA